jgi:hypothetical protein
MPGPLKNSSFRYFIDNASAQPLAQHLRWRIQVVSTNPALALATWVPLLFVNAHNMVPWTLPFYLSAAAIAPPLAAVGISRLAELASRSAAVGATPASQHRQLSPPPVADPQDRRAAFASDRGAGQLGFAGTAPKAVETAGLTTVPSDEFGGAPRVPMVPGSWGQHGGSDGFR